jgi:predicted MFS family arabinose efflux permease
MAVSKRSTSLWRNRDFLLLWSGQLISTTGSGITEIAFPLLVLAVTGSPAQAGLAGGLSMLTYMLLSLPAGALLDRWDRKRVMVFCDLGRAVSLGSIALALILGHLTLLHILLVVVVSGALWVCFDLAQLSCLPQVVAPEQLSEAMGQTQASTGIMNLLSPSLGAFLFTVRSLLPFFVDALSYFASVGSLLLIRTPFQQQREASRRNLRVDIHEGLHWLWHQPLLRTMALITSINVLCGAGYTLIIIVLAQQQHASNATIGLMVSIGGVGSILGSFVVGRLKQRFSFAQLILGTLWLYVVFWLLLAFRPPVLFLGIITTLLYFIGPFYNVTYVSRRLAVTPDALQSRVNSVARLIGLGLSPLGLALTGVLLQICGPQVTVLLSVSGQLLLAVVATVHPHIRQAIPLEKRAEEWY